jgi:hypothetical protein
MQYYQVVVVVVMLDEFGEACRVAKSGRRDGDGKLGKVED